MVTFCALHVSPSEKVLLLLLEEKKKKKKKKLSRQPKVTNKSRESLERD
jgi:hypothetical protein